MNETTSKTDKQRSERRGRKHHMVETSLHCGSVILFLAAAPAGIYRISFEGILSSHFGSFIATGLKNHIRHN